MLKVLRAASSQVDEMINKQHGYSRELEVRVAAILEAVRTRGDEALFGFAQSFDKAKLDKDNVEVSREEIEGAYTLVQPAFLKSLRKAKENIELFHRKQLRQSWLEPDETGSILGQVIRPLERVGIYVPGGTAAYPSSVLMNAVPAKVAGVREVVMVTPVKENNRVTPEVLVAAQEAGVSRIFKIGGAQAIAALAYGTESVPKVDKITGPGNVYVTLAKKFVYGQVDIDMLAGPSEILVIADSTAEPEWVAADLLSQAEHDVMASAILITPSKELAEKVMVETERLLEKLSRREIAEQALRDNGAIILVDSIGQGVELANRFAPEHLELMVEAPFDYLGMVKNAGAIFLGRYSPEPVGDYFAGPNHVLPTGGTARFYSPLNVDTFLKKTSVIAYSQESFREAAGDIITLAETEGLSAHASAIKVRVKKDGI